MLGRQASIGWTSIISCRRPTGWLLATPGLEEALRADVRDLAAATEAALQACSELQTVACHGDCHGFNTHMRTTGEGQRVAAFFDFDDGGPGPLAYDLAVYLWNILQGLAGRPFEAPHRAVWRAFLNGYAGRRDIPRADHAAILANVRAREIWFLGARAALATRNGRAPLEAPWLRARLAALRSWDEVCP